jgi:hypothetical protein
MSSGAAEAAPALFSHRALLFWKYAGSSGTWNFQGQVIARLDEDHLSVADASKCLLQAPRESLRPEIRQGIQGRLEGAVLFVVPGQSLALPHVRREAVQIGLQFDAKGVATQFFGHWDAVPSHGISTLVNLADALMQPSKASVPATTETTTTEQAVAPATETTTTTSTTMVVASNVDDDREEEPSDRAIAVPPTAQVLDDVEYQTLAVRVAGGAYRWEERLFGAAPLRSTDQACFEPLHVGQDVMVLSTEAGRDARWVVGRVMATHEAVRTSDLGAPSHEVAIPEGARGEASRGISKSATSPSREAVPWGYEHAPVYERRIAGLGKMIRVEVLRPRALPLLSPKARSILGRLAELVAERTQTYERLHERLFGFFSHQRKRAALEPAPMVQYGSSHLTEQRAIDQADSLKEVAERGEGARATDDRIRQTWKWYRSNPGKFLCVDAADAIRADGLSVQRDGQGVWRRIDGVHESDMAQAISRPIERATDPGLAVGVGIPRVQLVPRVLVRDIRGWKLHRQQAAVLRMRQSYMWKGLAQWKAVIAQIRLVEVAHSAAMCIQQAWTRYLLWKDARARMLARVREWQRNEQVQRAAAMTRRAERSFACQRAVIAEVQLHFQHADKLFELPTGGLDEGDRQVSLLTNYRMPRLSLEHLRLLSFGRALTVRALQRVHRVRSMRTALYRGILRRHVVRSFLTWKAIAQATPRELASEQWRRPTSSQVQEVRARIRPDHTDEPALAASPRGSLAARGRSLSVSQMHTFSSTQQELEKEILEAARAESAREVHVGGVDRARTWSAPPTSLRGLGRALFTTSGSVNKPVVRFSARESLSSPRVLSRSRKPSPRMGGAPRSWDPWWNEDASLSAGADENTLERFSPPLGTRGPVFDVLDESFPRTSGCRDLLEGRCTARLPAGKLEPLAPPNQTVVTATAWRGEQSEDSEIHKLLLRPPSGSKGTLRPESAKRFDIVSNCDVTAFSRVFSQAFRVLRQWSFAGGRRPVIARPRGSESLMSRPPSDRKAFRPMCSFVHYALVDPASPMRACGVVSDRATDAVLPPLLVPCVAPWQPAGGCLPAQVPSSTLAIDTTSISTALGFVGEYATALGPSRAVPSIHRKLQSWSLDTLLEPSSHVERVASASVSLLAYLAVLSRWKLSPFDDARLLWFVDEGRKVLRGAEAIALEAKRTIFAGLGAEGADLAASVAHGTSSLSADELDTLSLVLQAVVATLHPDEWFPGPMLSADAPADTMAALNASIAQMLRMPPEGLAKAMGRVYPSAVPTRTVQTLCRYLFHPQWPRPVSLNEPARAGAEAPSLRGALVFLRPLAQWVGAVTVAASVFQVGVLARGAPATAVDGGMQWAPQDADGIVRPQPTPAVAASLRGVGAPASVIALAQMGASPAAGLSGMSAWHTVVSSAGATFQFDPLVGLDLGAEDAQLHCWHWGSGVLRKLRQRRREARTDSARATAADAVVRAGGSMEGALLALQGPNGVPQRFLDEIALSQAVQPTASVPRGWVASYIPPVRLRRRRASWAVEHLQGPFDSIHALRRGQRKMTVLDCVRLSEPWIDARGKRVAPLDFPELEAHNESDDSALEEDTAQGVAAASPPEPITPERAMLLAARAEAEEIIRQAQEQDRVVDAVLASIAERYGEHIIGATDPMTAAHILPYIRPRDDPSVTEVGDPETLLNAQRLLITGGYRLPVRKGAKQGEGTAWHPSQGMILPRLPPIGVKLDKLGNRTVVSREEWKEFIAWSVGALDTSFWLVRGMMQVGPYPSGKACHVRRVPGLGVRTQVDPVTGLSVEYGAAGAKSWEASFLAGVTDAKPTMDVRDLDTVGPPIDEPLVATLQDMATRIRPVSEAAALARETAIGSLLVEGVSTFVCLLDRRELELRHREHETEIRRVARELRSRHNEMRLIERQRYLLIARRAQRAVEAGYAADRVAALRVEESAARARWDRVQQQFVKLPRFVHFVYFATPSLCAIEPDSHAVALATELERRIRQGQSLYIFSHTGRGRAALVAGLVMGRLYGLSSKLVIERMQRGFETTARAIVPPPRARALRPLPKAEDAAGAEDAHAWERRGEFDEGQQFTNPAHLRTYPEHIHLVERAREHGEDIDQVLADSASKVQVGHSDPLSLEEQVTEDATAAPPPSPNTDAPKKPAMVVHAPVLTTIGRVHKTAQRSTRVFATKAPRKTADADKGSTDSPRSAVSGEETKDLDMRTRSHVLTSRFSQMRRARKRQAEMRAALADAALKVPAQPPSDVEVPKLTCPEVPAQRHQLERLLAMHVSQHHASYVARIDSFSTAWSVGRPLGSGSAPLAMPPDFEAHLMSSVFELEPLAELADDE